MHQIKKFTDYLVLSNRDWDKKITKGVFGTIDLVHKNKYRKVLWMSNKLNLLEKFNTNLKWDHHLLYFIDAPHSVPKYTT